MLNLSLSSRPYSTLKDEKLDMFDTPKIPTKSLLRVKASSRGRFANLISSLQGAARPTPPPNRRALKALLAGGAGVGAAGGGVAIAAQDPEVREMMAQVQGAAGEDVGRLLSTARDGLGRTTEPSSTGRQGPGSAGGGVLGDLSNSSRDQKNLTRSVDDARSATKGTNATSYPIARNNSEAASSGVFADLRTQRTADSSIDAEEKKSPTKAPAAAPVEDKDSLGYKVLRRFPRDVSAGASSLYGDLMRGWRAGERSSPRYPPKLDPTATAPTAAAPAAAAPAAEAPAAEASRKTENRRAWSDEEIEADFDRRAAAEGRRAGAGVQGAVPGPIYGPEPPGPIYGPEPPGPIYGPEEAPKSTTAYGSALETPAFGPGFDGRILEDGNAQPTRRGQGILQQILGQGKASPPTPPTGYSNPPSPFGKQLSHPFGSTRWLNQHRGGSATQPALSQDASGRPGFFPQAGPQTLNGLLPSILGQ